MTRELGEKIDRRLRDGWGKDRIRQSLKGSASGTRLVFLLNDLPTVNRRRTYLLLNLTLAAILLSMTTIKLWAAVSIGRINIYFFLALVVPLINLHVLQKILRFRRTGYQYLFVLSLLSLVQPENHRPLEATLLGAMLLLSAFLYRRLFPKEELIKAADE
jgi:hypothetical protein